MTETPTPKQPNRDEGFIEFLRNLASQPGELVSDDMTSAQVQERKNLAALAALRRGLGKEPGTAPEMYPYVVPFLPDGSRPPQEDAPYYLVASLFAWHQNDWRGQDARGLGGSLARLRWQTAQDRGEPPEAGDSVERRFVALLNSSRVDLPEHLRTIVGLLRSADIPVSWSKLLKDIQRWHWTDRRVQRRWAREFWGSDQNQVAEPGTLSEANASLSNPS